MDHDTLDRVVAAYGGGESLAQAVGINAVTLRRWRSRGAVIPQWFQEAVAAALVRRADELRQDAAETADQAKECQELAQEITGGAPAAGARPASK